MLNTMAKGRRKGEHMAPFNQTQDPQSELISFLSLELELRKPPHLCVVRILRKITQCFENLFESQSR